jgi:hypothetical protein
MHPSDVRMNPWGPLTYTVGDPTANFPMACWQTNNNPVTIHFNLAAPSSLIARFVTSSHINLAWSDNSSNEVNFLVERSTDRLSYSLIAAVSADVANYSDWIPTAASAYYYRVRSANSAGNSAYSNTSTPPPPTISTAFISENHFLLNGSGGFPGGTCYILATTNLALPLSLWPRIATNRFDTNGSFPFAENPQPLSPQKFYTLQLP